MCSEHVNDNYFFAENLFAVQVSDTRPNVEQPVGQRC